MMERQDRKRTRQAEPKPGPRDGAAARESGPEPDARPHASAWTRTEAVVGGRRLTLFEWDAEEPPFTA